MSDDQPSERRRSKRSEVVLKVEYADRRDLLADYLTDLGEGGMFVCTQVPFTVGEELAFVLSFPGWVAPMPLRGVVRWRRGGGAGPGIGVELLFDNNDQRARLVELLAEIRGEAGDLRGAATFRVLLVEDNAMAHDLFRHTVQRLHEDSASARHLEILSAHNGREALEIATEVSVDIAIIDYFLPVVTGGQLIRSLRELQRHRATPILAISAGGEKVREECLRAGADLYLDKPVRIRQLLATLGLLLRRAE